jgi:hypothetical protein
VCSARQLQPVSRGTADAAAVRSTEARSAPLQGRASET